MDRRTPRGRGSRLLAVTLLVAGLGIVADASDVAAIGITHKLTTSNPGNAGGSIETAARITYTCNDTTGNFKFNISNVQVINPDRITPWSAYVATYRVWDPTLTNSVFYNVNLTQNSVNGLFNGSNAGMLTPFERTNICVTGAVFGAGDIDTFGSKLFLATTLT